MATVNNTADVVKVIWDSAFLFDRQGLRDSIDIYQDNWVDIIECELRNQFTDQTSINNLRPLITTEINLCKKVVNETAMVYEDPAIRYAQIGETTDEAGDTEIIKDERYEEIVEQTQLDIVMKTVNRYTRLLNHVLIRPCVRNLKLELDIILPDNFEIFTDMNDWRDIVAIKYYVGQRPSVRRDFSVSGLITSTNTKQPALENRRGFLWVKKPIELEKEVFEPGVYQIDTMKGTASWKSTFMENPYKDVDGNPILPFVLTFKEWPVDKLLNFSTDSSVPMAAVNFAIYLTMENELMKFQAYKQMVITGGTDLVLPNPMAVDPSKLWVVKTENANAGVNVLDMQADIKQFGDNVKARMSLFLAQFGISSSQFTLSGNPQSGYQMKIDRQPLMEIRNNDIGFYRAIEHELFNVIKIVNNTDLQTKKINEKAEFHIDFAEVKFDNSPSEDVQEWSFRFANNLATPVDYLMEKNPDLSRDEATKIYTDNRAMNAQRTATPTLNLPTTNQATNPVK